MGISDITVEISFGTDALDTPSYTDVTGDAYAVSIRRGRSSQLGEFSTGTCTLELDNSDGDYDPTNTSSPHRSGGDTLILPRRRVKVSHLTDVLFVGFIASRDGWDFGYDTSGNVSTVTVNCHDYLGMLATAELDPVSPAVGAGVSPSTRLTTIFNAVGAPASTDLDTGITTLQATTRGENAGQMARDVVLAEGGALYVTGDGTVTFDDRHAPLTETRMTTSQATFDDSGNVTFRGVGRSYSADMYNRIRLQRSGGDEITVDNVTSQNNYGIMELAETGLDLQVENDNEVPARGEWLRDQYSTPRFHPAQVVLKPLASSSELTEATTRQLRDRVTVTFQPPGGGDQASHEAFIEAIDHTILVRPQQRWDTTFTLSSAERFAFVNFSDFLELDHSTNGKLGTGKLAY